MTLLPITGLSGISGISGISGLSAPAGLSGLSALQGGATAPLAPAAGPTAPTAATAPTSVDGSGAPSSFGQLLADKIGSVQTLQAQADQASQAVATGQSDDLAGATIAVEKASIALQLAGAVRNKAVDAYQEIMRMQV